MPYKSHMGHKIWYPRKRKWRKKDTEALVNVLASFEESEYQKNSDGEKGRERMKRLSLMGGIGWGSFVAILGIVLLIDGIWIVGLPILVASPWLGWKITMGYLKSTAKRTYSERSRRAKIERLGGVPPATMEKYKKGRLFAGKPQMDALDKALDDAIVDLDHTEYELPFDEPSSLYRPRRQQPNDVSSNLPGVEQEPVHTSSSYCSGPGSRLAVPEHADDELKDKAVAASYSVNLGALARKLDGSYCKFPPHHPRKSFLVARARLVHEVKHSTQMPNYWVADELGIGRNSVGKILRGVSFKDVHDECGVCSPCDRLAT